MLYTSESRSRYEFHAFALLADLLHQLLLGIKVEAHGAARRLDVPIRLLRQAQHRGVAIALPFEELVDRDAVDLDPGAAWRQAF